jgi:hypothetical protein
VDCSSSLLARRADTASTDRRRLPGYGSSNGQKLLGLTLEEIRELVGLAVRCSEGEIIPRLEEVLEAKLAETERKMGELSAFRQNLIYYRERASALSGGVLPADRYCEDVSFCGCLEAVTEGGEKL